MYPVLRSRLDNGRDLNVPLVPAKFGSYESLTCSSTIPVSDPNGILVVKDCEVDFYEDVISLDDSDSGEPVMKEVLDFPIHKIVSDGFGLMLPSRAEIWSRELELGYLPSGLCTRPYAFGKGMLITFDFMDFAKNVAHSYIVQDAWGDPVDIRDVDVILTTSMLKLWDSYPNFSTYMENCKKNKYCFCITKICPEELENERNLNYQFIQSYQLSDDEIQQLIQPTIDEVNDILGDDYKKSLLFLRGMNITENTMNISENNYIKALMIDSRMSKDPYVRSCIHKMIKNRIDEAKVGVIKVNGNFQMSCGDPYALCQSIFSLPVTGLLKKGEFYSQYWSDKNISKVVCFRAPMTCHNNIRKLHFPATDEQKYWFKYIKTMIIFNSWDTTAEAENGQDHDGDQNLTTDNPILYQHTRDLKSIICIQRKAPKKIITEADLIQANIDSFGDEIGIYTNGITSQFEVQANFDTNTPEYNELDYRIKCGQLFQQNAIDKAKGIVAKPRPKHWFNNSFNKIHPEDTPEIIKKKQFNKKIAATKKPYFMTYIYPNTAAEYTKYVKNSNNKCQVEFKTTISELENKPNKTTQEVEFLQYYYSKFPVGMNPCIMNKICWWIEQEFDGYLSMYKTNTVFDYSILKSETSYSKSEFHSIKQIYQKYCDKVISYQKLSKLERVDNEQKVSDRQVMLNHFIQACTIACPDEDKLCNIVLDLCYSTEKSKCFAWELCGDIFIRNLLKQNDWTISYPIKDKNGDIEFGGEHFKMSKKRLEEF